MLIARPHYPNSLKLAFVISDPAVCEIIRLDSNDSVFTKLPTMKKFYCHKVRAGATLCVSYLERSILNNHEVHNVFAGIFSYS